MAPANYNDLPEDLRRELRERGIRAPRRRSMSMDEVRTYAIRVLNVMADLSPGERRRVLRQAEKLNAR